MSLCAYAHTGGESQLVDDLRGPNTLSMLIRVATHNAFVNHALATSDDGGAHGTYCAADACLGLCSGGYASVIISAGASTARV